MDIAATLRAKRQRRPVMTRPIAYAIGRDTADTSMRVAGRTEWSISDWKAGCAAMVAALKLVA